MDPRGDDFTPEELALAERLLDQKLRAASRERYRRLVAGNDPELYRGPVRIPRDDVAALREEVAAEVRARRSGGDAPAKAEAAPRRAGRWPWQRR